MKAIVLLVMPMVLFAGWVPSACGRTWTNRAGRTIEAEMVGTTDGKVRLRKPDGKVYDYPLDQLSDADQAFVRESALPGGQAGGSKAARRFRLLIKETHTATDEQGGQKPSEIEDTTHYTVERRGNEAIVRCLFREKTVKAAGQTVTHMRGDPSSLTLETSGKNYRFTPKDLDSEARSMFREGFETPVLSVVTDPQGGAPIRKDLISDHQRGFLFDQGELDYIALFQSSFPERQPQYSFPARLAILGDLATVPGEVTLSKASIQDDRADRQKAKLQGVLRLDSGRHKVLPIVVKNVRYDLSGELTFDRGTKQCIAGTLSVTSAMESSSQGANTTHRGKIIVSLEELTSDSRSEPNAGSRSPVVGADPKALQEAEALLRMAKNLLDNQKPERAREYAQKAIDKAPNSDAARAAKTLLESLEHATPPSDSGNGKHLAVISFAGIESVIKYLMAALLDTGETTPAQRELMKESISRLAAETMHGVAPERPWGMVVRADGGNVHWLAFVPVVPGVNWIAADLTSESSLLAHTGGTPQKTIVDGMLTLKFDNHTVYLKQVGNWLFITSTREALADTPEAPEKALAGLAPSYVMAAQVWPTNAPEEFSQLVKAAVQKPDKLAPIGDAASQSRISDQVMHYLAVAQKCKRVLVGLSTDLRTGSMYLDCAVTAPEESQGDLKKMFSDIAVGLEQSLGKDLLIVSYPPAASGLSMRVEIKKEAMAGMRRTLSNPPRLGNASSDGEADAAGKLRLARSLIQANRLDAAKTRLNEIVRQYPKTKAADEARQLLSEIGQ